MTTTHAIARLSAGTILLIAAAVMRLAWAGGWETVLLVVLGLVLVLASFAQEGAAR